MRNVEEAQQIAYEFYDVVIAPQPFFQKNFTSLDITIRWRHEQTRLIYKLARRERWVVFPWEYSEKRIKRRLLKNGEDPDEWCIIVGAKVPLPNENLLPKKFKGIQVLFDIRQPAKLL